jgi:anti-sigma factor RsiW
VSPTRSHPSHDDWIRWIEEHPGDDRTTLEKHLQGCARCREIVQVLRTLESARRASSWETPPEALAASAEKRPSEPTVVPPPETESVEWSLAGVRAVGGSLATAGEARFASQVFDDGEIGILAVPPRGDGRWIIRGTIWLRRGEGDIHVSLVHGEHVISTTTVRSGVDFEIEEVVGAGWHLEVRLPGGGGLRLEEPGS